MPIIVITSIIIYFIVIAWTWKSLGFIEITKKIMFILIGLIAMYFITLITYSISKGELNYQNAQMQISIKNILIIIFTGINSIIVLPQIAKILE